MTNLAGHDLQAVLDAFQGVDDDTPTFFIVYTIKGFGLPFQGHKDNHSGLMTPTRWRLQDGHGDRRRRGVGPVRGPDAAPAELQGFVDQAPFAAQGRRRTAAPAIAIPAALPAPNGQQSTRRRPSARS